LSFRINSIQTWCDRSLAGRGVLIDYASYAERHNILVNHVSPHSIALKDVNAIAQERGPEFRTGDVLFLRTGYAAVYKELTKEGRVTVTKVKEWCGLTLGRDITEWLWERQFAAVASDTPGIEVERTCAFLVQSTY
jgi:kynurenine formamidase